MNGLLYRPGDSADLRSCVNSLFDGFTRAALAVHARPSVERRTWKAVNDQLLQHFERACTRVAFSAVSRDQTADRETADAA